MKQDKVLEESEHIDLVQRVAHQKQNARETAQSVEGATKRRSRVFIPNPLSLAG